MAVGLKEMVGRGEIDGSKVGEKVTVGWCMIVGHGEIVGFGVVVDGLLGGELGT